MKETTGLTRTERLEKLVRLNTLINSSLDIDTVLEKILEAATEVMEAGAASIMLLDKETGDLLCQQATGQVGKQVCKEYRIPQGQGIAGWVAQHKQPLRIENAYEDSRFNSGMDQKTGFRTRSILCVPLIAKDKLVGVAQVLNKEALREDRTEIIPFDAEDEELFTLFGQQAAIAIENTQLHRSLLNQERLSWDLNVAREIQMSLLPQRALHLPGLEIQGYYEPSFQVGGDIYDFFPISQDKIALVIGDVSGKGVSAALYMVRFLSDLRALAFQQSEPEVIVNHLNRIQCERSRLGMFITLIFGILDLKTFRLKYVCAGHPPLCLRSQDGTCRFIRGVSDTPIGIFEDTPFRTNEREILPGDLLLGYTDGIVEVRNSEGTMIGSSWLCSLLESLETQTDAVLQKVVDEVHRFGGQESFYDDIALMLLHRE